MVGLAIGPGLLEPLTKIFREVQLKSKSETKSLGAAYGKAHLVALQFFDYAMAAKAGGTDPNNERFSANDAAFVPWVLGLMYRPKSNYEALTMSESMRILAGKLFKGLVALAHAERDFFETGTKSLRARFKSRFPAQAVFSTLNGLRETIQHLRELKEQSPFGVSPSQISRNAHSSRSLSDLRLSSEKIQMGIFHPQGKAKKLEIIISTATTPDGSQVIRVSQVVMALIQNGLCWHRDMAMLANSFVQIAKSNGCAIFAGSFDCQFKSSKKEVCSGPGKLIIEVDIPLPIGRSSNLCSHAWSLQTTAGFVDELKLFHKMQENERNHVLLFDKIDKAWIKNMDCQSGSKSHLTTGMKYGPQPYVGLDDATLDRRVSLSRVFRHVNRYFDERQEILEECRRRPHPFCLDFRLAMFGGFLTGHAQPVLPSKPISIGFLSRATFDMARKFSGLRLQRSTAPHMVSIETGLYASENAPQMYKDVLSVLPTDPLLLEIQKAGVIRFTRQEWLHAFSNRRLFAADKLYAFCVDVDQSTFDYTGIHVGLEIAGNSASLGGSRFPKIKTFQEEQAALDTRCTPYRTIEGILDDDSLRLPSKIDPQTSPASSGYKFCVLLYGFHEMGLKFWNLQDYSWIQHLPASKRGQGLPVRKPLPLAEIGAIAVLTLSGEVDSVLVSFSRNITIKYPSPQPATLKYANRGMIGATCACPAPLSESLNIALHMEIKVCSGKARAVKSLLIESREKYGWLEYLG